MSVINRMLQELEARHEEPAALPGPVRAVPPARGTLPWRGILLALALVVLLAAAGFVWTRPSATPRGGVDGAPRAAPAHPAADSAAAPPSSAPAAAAPVAMPPAAEAVAAPQLELAADIAAPARPAAGATPAPAAGASPPPPAAVPERVPPATAPKPASSEGLTVKQVTPAQQADQRYREALAGFAARRSEAAEPLLREALNLDPRHTGARQALFALLLEQRRFDEAERLLNDGLAQPGAPVQLAMALARLQLERGNKDGALATLERYAGAAERDADYLAFHAALLERVGRHADAVGRYQAALGLKPQEAVWWLGLAMSLEALGRTAEAAQAFDRARSLPGLSAELRAFVEERLARLAARL